jgi:hypothetical protein
MDNTKTIARFSFLGVTVILIFQIFFPEIIPSNLTKGLSWLLLILVLTGVIAEYILWRSKNNRS